MHRFFHEGSLASDQEIVLSNEESHHLAKVVPIREGEDIELVNGQGARARVLSLLSAGDASQQRQTYEHHRCRR